MEAHLHGTSRTREECPEIDVLEAGLLKQVRLEREPGSRVTEATVSTRHHSHLPLAPCDLDASNRNDDMPLGGLFSACIVY